MPNAKTTSQTSVLASAGREVTSHVIHASFDLGADALAVETSDGQHRLFPRESIQTLSSISPADLGPIEIQGGGYYLSWPKHDFDLYVPELLKGITGNRYWMSQLGRRGGNATSPRKGRAARINGRKGGRPAKRRSQSERQGSISALVVSVEAASGWKERFELSDFALAFDPKELMPVRPVPRFSTWHLS